jgi:hypothetical protein
MKLKSLAVLSRKANSNSKRSREALTRRAARCRRGILIDETEISGGFVAQGEFEQQEKPRGPHTPSGKMQARNTDR